MAQAQRSRVTGSLGEPRHSFNHLSLDFDDRARNLNTGPPKEPSPIPTVVVAEDDDDTRAMFRVLLESKGYRVVEAGDGEQVLKVTTRENPGLVLLDLGLPRLNGLSVIRTLRNQLNVLDVPVVVITGHEKHFKTAVAAGCDDYLLKPLDFEQLDAVLDYYVPIKTHPDVA